MLEVYIYMRIAARANGKINESGEKYKNYLTSIQSCYDVVRQNRSELAPQVSGAETTETEETAEADASLEGLDEE